MKEMMGFSKRHLFLVILVPLGIFVVVASYHRFLVVHDYDVKYQGSCDPAQQQCFVGCTDSACADTYFYDEVRKYEPDIAAECGLDVTDCKAADACSATDRNCSVTYCTPAAAAEEGVTCQGPSDGTSSSTAPMTNESTTSASSSVTNTTS